MARRARRARHQAREALAALPADIGEAESHSPTPRMVHVRHRRRNCIVMDVVGSDLMAPE